MLDVSNLAFAYDGAAAVRARLGSTIDLRAYLDLVAVGTIADVMPLEGDNRILTRVGLDRLASGQGRPGLRALAREARLRSRVRAHDVGFAIAPMLDHVIPPSFAVRVTGGSRQMRQRIETDVRWRRCRLRPSARP